MSDKKLFSAKEAALAVLAKTKEILEDSSLMKAEKLKKQGNTLGAAIGFPGAAQTAPAPAPSSTPMPKSEMKKYETENKKPAGNRYGKIEKDQKPTERDYNEYEVKSGNSKDSDGPRLARQTSPSTNPKEEAEGNNKDGGMEPEYEFKDKVSKELAKEKASHMVKSQSGMHTVVYKSAAFEKSEDQANDLNKAESKHDRCVKDVERNSPDVKNAHAVCVAEGVKPAKWSKSENPDEKEDAELGEQVEKDVEQHHKDTGNEVDKEGHDLMAKPEDKSEGQTEHASTSAIPRLVLSAKLSKFMEHMHSKRKNAQAQGQEAVGQDASDAPPARSTQAGQPDMDKAEKGVNTPMSSHIKGKDMKPGSKEMLGMSRMGNMAGGGYPEHAVSIAENKLDEIKRMPKPNLGKAESSFDKLKHKIENKEGYSEKGAAGAAYEAGVKKYGKSGMAAKAAAGRKK